MRPQKPFRMREGMKEANFAPQNAWKLGAGHIKVHYSANLYAPSGRAQPLESGRGKEGAYKTRVLSAFIRPDSEKSSPLYVSLSVISTKGAYKSKDFPQFIRPATPKRGFSPPRSKANHEKSPPIARRTYKTVRLYRNIEPTTSPHSRKNASLIRGVSCSLKRPQNSIDV